MKKSDLWTGIAMIAVGLACLAAAFLNTLASSLFAGLFGALTFPGVMQVYKYLKWSSPKHHDEYQERLEQERIDLRDERKEMLRNKSGRYAYLLGLVLTAASILVFFALEMLNVIGESTGRLITIFLGGFLLVQYAAGLVIYRLLARKY